ncbi:glycosyltransferase family 2 protein [Ancylobacter sp.]|uniref:glycosyltransferase family 2 protein n=1 Tax=Ancylobacter sp. TaxID=1872567 RepID=UPI003D14B911
MSSSDLLPRQDHATTNSDDLAVGGTPVAGLRAPLLSFVVVNWNYGRFVGQMLESIQEQDYPHFECVVVDNGSSDNSLEVIERYVGSDSRFRLIRLAQNIGQLGGAFTGLRAVSGEFVALIDADDVLFPNFASTHIQVHLSLVDTAALTSSNVIEVNAENRVLSSTCWRQIKRARDAENAMREDGLVARLPQISAAFYRSALAPRVSRAPREATGWLWSPGTSNVMRRSIAELFVNDETQPPMIPSDSYFLKLCHAFGGTAFIDMPLSSRRVHGANYFASREEISGVRTTSQAFADGIRGIDVDLENMRSVVTNAVKNYWVLGSYFWTLLDNLTSRESYARSRYYNAPSVVTLFRDYSKTLLRASGKNAFLWAVTSRFNVMNSRKIVRAAFDGHLPVAYYVWMAMPIGFPPQGWWRKIADSLR